MIQMKQEVKNYQLIARKPQVSQGTTIAAVNSTKKTYSPQSVAGGHNGLEIPNMCLLQEAAFVYLVGGGAGSTSTGGFSPVWKYQGGSHALWGLSVLFSYFCDEDPSHR